MTIDVRFHDEISGDKASTEIAQLEKLSGVLTTLKADNFRFLSVLKDRDHLQEIQKVGDQLLKKFSSFIVLGTGGSALGAAALKQAFINPHVAQKVFILDNPDPSSVHHLKEVLDLSKTCILAVSKSGGTIETLSLLLAFQTLYEQQNLALEDHFKVLTTKAPSALYEYALEKNLEIIEHDPEIGGRFSVFSNVGLLPAYLMGLDIEAFQKGALEMLEGFTENADINHPVVQSALKGSALEQGRQINLNVMMPYCDRLQFFTRWFIQLYAESLGKEGRGLTPIPALGTVDQHAQLQLFHDGPKDKWVTILRLKGEKDISCLLAATVKQEKFSALCGREIHEILEVEALATRDSLHAAGLPVREIILEALSLHTLGSLMAFCMLEVILTAAFMEINAFDQPGVEDSKNRIKALLQDRSISA